MKRRTMKDLANEAEKLLGPYPLLMVWYTGDGSDGSDSGNVAWNGTMAELKLVAIRLIEMADELAAKENDE